MCCLLWEHTSLKAFWFLARNFRRVLAKRRLIQSRRRVDDEYMASWFQYAPVSQAGAEENAAPALGKPRAKPPRSARM